MSKEKMDSPFDFQAVMSAIALHGWHGYPHMMPPGDAPWPSKEEVMQGLKNELQKHLKENLPDILALGENRKEQLLEICMTLFEGMQTHRGGILRMMDLDIKHPQKPLSLLCTLNHILDEGLNAVGIQQNSILGALRYHGVHVIFSLACHTWRSDTTLDMEKTHLFLDQQLSKGASFMARYDEG